MFLFNLLVIHPGYSHIPTNHPGTSKKLSSSTPLSYHKLWSNNSSGLSQTVVWSNENQSKTQQENHSNKVAVLYHLKLCCCWFVVVKIRLMTFTQMTTQFIMTTIEKCEKWCPTSSIKYHSTAVLLLFGSLLQWSELFKNLIAKNRAKLSIDYLLRSVRVSWETKSHVLLITKSCHQLGDNALASNGPSHFKAHAVIQHFTIELGLRLYAKHPQGGGHIEIPGYPHTPKVHIESHTPHWQPVWNMEV